MKVAWLSSRVLGTDLCSTTQINLADGLVKRGHKVVFYSPGNVSNSSFEHVKLERSSIKGMQSWSVARNLLGRLSDFDDFDVILVDWTIGKLMQRLSTPSILVDRGPPADSGILAILQWRPWHKAWSNAIRGTVVSPAHRKFVADNTQTPKASIEVIPAGVDLDLFQSRQKDGPIKLVYHGRVDINRGVMALPMILAGLHSNGIEATMHIHGSGNAVNRLKKIGMHGLEVTEAKPQDELAGLLSNYDIGLLPMPENKIWNLASPLKRSEYLASGMVVCGIEHEGHQIEDSGDWLQLFPQEQFIARTVSWIISLDRQLLTALQKESRAYAEENSSWSHSVDVLESIILS